MRFFGYRSETKNGVTTVTLDMEGIVWIAALAVASYFFQWSGAYSVGVAFVWRCFLL